MNAQGDGAGQLPQPGEIAPFVHQGIDWLVKAQHQNGGWGGGSNANQQLRDPHKVKTDPATTAFAAMALLRVGHTATPGNHQETTKRATEYLVRIVEESSESGPLITDMTGTQPQAKLGPLVDTSMTAQFLSRALPTLTTDSELHARVDAALEKCLRKLQDSQKEDGSWGFAGWAPVLQSSLSCSAFELAQANGKKVDQGVLDRARKYHMSNVDSYTGKAKAAAGAGVELYAFSAGQRGTAGEARAAQEAVQEAKDRGELAADAKVSQESLEQAGLTAPRARSLSRAYRQQDSQSGRLSDDNLLVGFGSNGGEEFLSYLLTSESLVITGGEQWEKWNSKMHERLEKIQNPDGSWSGHHCITSPVFCTAAVVQCLTTDRDAPVLLQIAKAAAATREK